MNLRVSTLSDSVFFLLPLIPATLRDAISTLHRGGIAGTSIVVSDSQKIRDIENWSMPPSSTTRMVICLALAKAMDIID